MNRNFTQVRLVFLIFLLLVGIGLEEGMAQDATRVISGTVKDASTGATLPGVAVKLKNSTNGISTDAEGKFALKVPATGILEISSIGYEKQEVTLTSATVYNVSLKESAQNLNDVVVVGYGSMRKKDLTGSIVQIIPDKIANENPKTVQDILRGTPGLSVGYDPSAKGGGSMQLRGQRSVYTGGGHNDPLIVLDGMIFYGELSEVNPDDIGQIDVLKDASAAAIYGSRAASGVIIITTKKVNKVSL